MTTIPADLARTRMEWLRRDLDAHLDPALPTPRSIFLARTAADHWAEVQVGVAAASAGGITVNTAYSIKTNPDPELLMLARSSGMLVEAISQLELRKALESGFPPAAVVLNGPGKWWPRRVACMPLRAVFCDSLVELDQVCQWMHQGDALADVVGVRIRPPGLTSRFGIELSAPRALEEVVCAVRQLPRNVGFGVHVHLQRELSSGLRRWSMVDATLRTAVRLEQAASRPVRTLDIGGGWGPAALLGELLPGLARFCGRAAATLAHLQEVLIEPGRGLAEPTMAMLTRVLEVRSRTGKEPDVIVDAAVSDLPDIARHPHRLFIRTAGSGQWQALAWGSGSIFGRSCMESDVLATCVTVPSDVAVGDYVAVADAGAYDVSKSYAFGCG
ncbi:MAG: hypothetical protein ACRD12_18315 [Acidimicrobiales bacterium]